MSTVYAAIPSTTVTSAETVELDSLDFATEQRKTYSHEGVGSGMFDVKSTNNQSIIHQSNNTNCTLNSDSAFKLN